MADSPPTRYVIVLAEEDDHGVLRESHVGSSDLLEDGKSMVASLRSGWLGDTGGPYRAALLLEAVTGQVLYATDCLAAGPGDEVVEYAICPVCHEWIGVARRAAPRHGRCPRCKAIVTVPAPSIDPRGDRIWIDTYKARRLTRRDQWMHEAARRVEWLRRVIPPPARVLEVGCASGEFVRVALDAGYTAEGIEPNASMAREARLLAPDAPIHEGTLDDVRYIPGSFDAVAMFHVLEHLPQPISTLVQIRELLRSSGVVIAEVPNGASIGVRTHGTAWEHAAPTEHVTLPTPPSLRVWFPMAGFGKVQISRLTMNVYDRRSSRDRLRAALRGRLGLSRDLLRVTAYKPAR